jgi:hypothetical protein
LVLVGNCWNLHSRFAQVLSKCLSEHFIVWLSWVFYRKFFF